jgi:hypothetical protein
VPDYQPAHAGRATGVTALLKSSASMTGVVAGVAYGLTARFVARPSMGGAFAVMTLAFLFLVPFVLGALTVASVRQPSILYRVLAPWIPMTLVVLVSALIGWEGAICIIMAMPVLLVFASVGGLIGGMTSLHRWGVRSALMAAPFLVAPLENRFSAPVRLVETVTEIDIAAPVAAVWPLVTSVDSIRPAEQRPALFTRLGFPRPVSATITGSGVGAIRQARFERGLVFTETVTHWNPERRLSFTIDPNTESIPPTTLDPHVTIGGPFFDVLTGTYELESRDDGRSTRLLLRSRHRVSTRFNIYSVWWAERIMASIQWNILRVHKERAERPS